MDFPRSAGILLSVSSLPGPFGIGTLGQEARQFVDRLAAAGQRWWQLLPLGPTSYGDSPYQSPSAFAGNDYFIDPRQLYEDGFIDRRTLDATAYSGPPEQVDYAFVQRSRRRLFRQALTRFSAAPPADFEAFCHEHEWWLEDYTLFLAIKEAHRGLPLWRWEKEVRNRHPRTLAMWRVTGAEQIAYHRMVQYFFYRQWNALRDYAHGRGVHLIGDIPIYVAADSADVWSNPHIFDLAEDKSPRAMAGCPPDAFSEDGQLWGNPVYDWRALRLSGYHFWLRRLRHTFSQVDVLRIDHFRGLASYYAIPAGASTARAGTWRAGPGMSLWRAVRRRLGDLPIIAEDLGFLTPEVETLLADSGFPGMKVLQFAFDGAKDNTHLPYNHPRNSIVYTGTHDNNTLVGWLNDLTEEERGHIRRFLRVPPEESLHRPLLAAALASPAAVCILPLQDVLGLDGTARMNTPSTVGGNWQWRATASQLHPAQPCFRWLADNTALYGRRSDTD
ncbi:MAG: 4-alpha-glucanotransferase [Clostridia bacterium]|nr:4-alpha-glucanotransferase [Clostridia bacterium]